MEILQNITLKDNFFRNFDLKIIPEKLNFVVITGINGSGKSKLLDSIKAELGGNKNHFYIRSGDQNKILEEVYGAQQKQEAETNLFNSLTPLRQRFRQNPDRNQLTPEEREQLNLIETTDKKITEFSDVELKEKIRLVPIESLKKNIENLQVAASFVGFNTRRTEIGNDTCITSNETTNEERKSIISAKLKEIYQTDRAPWDIINEKFREYNFKHKISSPSSGTYQPKFITDDGSEINFSDLSSGEKAIVRLILWSYSDSGNNKHKLLMMDEFDAHLNPSMAKMFIAIVEDVLVKQFEMQVIMTTHSPSTVAYCKEESLFWMENFSLTQKTKNEVIELLTPGILTFRKDRLLLLTTKENIIFTEGETDIDYIKAAAEVLGFKDIIDKCEFIPAYGDRGKDYFDLFTNNKISKLENSKKIIVIFDYDKKGIDAFNKTCGKQQSIPSDNNNTYTPLEPYDKENGRAMLLPLNNEEYKNEFTHGYYLIEFLFESSVLMEFKNGCLQGECVDNLDNLKKQSLNDRCYWPPKLGQNITIKKLDFSQEEKGIFAEYVKNNKDKIKFDNFKPLLEEIKKFVEPRVAKIS
jgi:predicted ATPase